jgi:hypothetical protein
MRARWLALLWLLVGVAVWCGWFDQVVADGVNYYLRRQAEFQMHLLHTEPSMTTIMADARHHAAVTASIWAGLVVGLGWGTIWARRK